MTDVVTDVFPLGFGAVEDEGIELPLRGFLNFIGAGVTASDDLANNATVVNIPGGGGGGGSAHTIEDEHVPLTQRDALDFVGAGVTVTDDAINDRTIVTIPSDAEFIRDTIGSALIAGANVSVAVNDPANTITIGVTGLTSAQISDFVEASQDAAASLLTAGTGISLSYNDPGNQLTIAVSGLTSSNITGFNESVDDRVAALLVAGSNVSLTYDDTANTLTVASTGGGGTGGHVIEDEATPLSQRTNLNFRGALNATDNAGADTTEVDVVGTLPSGGLSGQFTVKASDDDYDFEFIDLTIDTGSVSGLDEFVRDTVGDTLVAGSAINIVVDDPSDTITIGVVGAYVAGGTDVSIGDGGTGASDAPTALANLGASSTSFAIAMAVAL